MRKTEQGWVILIISGEIMPYSFRLTRRQCINDFVAGSSQDWAYWKSIGIKCVKAVQTTTTV